MSPYHHPETPKKVSQFQAVDDEKAAIFQKLKTIDLEAESRNMFMWMVADKILEMKAKMSMQMNKLTNRINDQDREIKYLKKVIKQQKSQLGLFK